jgi:hypothetical protein
MTSPEKRFIGSINPNSASSTRVRNFPGGVWMPQVHSNPPYGGGKVGGGGDSRGEGSRGAWVPMVPRVSRA